jgi:hypothetical protein
MLQKHLVARAIQAGFAVGAVGAIAGAMGCAELADGDADQSALESHNGIMSINGIISVNGINSANGFNSVNGFNSANGMTSVNGINSANGLMTTDGGRETVEYLVRCALAAGDTLVKQDQYGVSHTFQGALGLAPAWKNGACDTLCREYVSGCMLAHVNTAGIHVPIWVVSGNAAMGWGQDPAYPNQEGTFFGDIFNANNIGELDAYYCDGTGFDKDVVAGRIGSNQVGAPYRNMYASKYCKTNACIPSDQKTADNVSDGYKQCVMGRGSHQAWNHPVTVWRQNRAFNASGQVVPGVTADGRTVRYDFESGVNSWASTNSQLVVSSVSEAGGQTGTKSLKATYGSGASTLRMQGPTGLSLAAGTKVSFYIYLSATSKLTQMNPFVKKQGGNEWKVANDTCNLLKGSWNIVTITVPAGAIGSQVGVEFKTSGAFTAYLDAVTW